MPQPHIQVILADDAIPTALQAALQRTGATAGFAPLAEALRGDRPSTADAVVIVVPDDTGPVAGPLRVLFDKLAEHPRATLVMRANGTPAPPITHPAALPVAFAGACEEHDLSGRLSTMLEMRTSLDSLHQGLVHHRRSGENIARRYVNQLRLASQVQREFLPEELPRFGAVSFDVLFRPVDYVSGDIYDVHRLDEDHVGIALADATGHGIPAALLTVYIKRALRGKEIENGSYRILSPDEVLLRLNDDILDAHLTECPFVAALYAVLNMHTYELTLARGGAPFPILRTASGQVKLIESQGSVVGVLPNSHFELMTVQMQPGDSLVLYSDGLERIVSPEQAASDVPAGLRRAASRLSGVRRMLPSRNDDGGEPGTVATTAVGATHGEIATAGALAAASARAAQVSTLTTNGPVKRTALTAPSRNGGRFGGHAGGSSSGAPNASAHDLVTESTWYATLRDRGTVAAMEQAAGRQRALRRMGYPLDDLTLLTVQIDG